LYSFDYFSYFELIQIRQNKTNNLINTNYPNKDNLGDLRQFNQNTVTTRIVDAATILGFDLFGAATIQTESTIQ
jgi:hypothetical protein